MIPASALTSALTAKIKGIVSRTRDPQEAAAKIATKVW